MEVKSARSDLCALAREQDSILLTFKTNFLSGFLSPGEKPTFCIPKLDSKVLWCQKFTGHEHAYKL